MTARVNELEVVQVVFPGGGKTQCSAAQAKRCGYTVVRETPEPQVTQENPVMVPSVHAEARTTPLEGQDPPAASVVRAWARENNVPGVRAKGKVPQAAFDAYNKAH